MDDPVTTAWVMYLLLAAIVAAVSGASMEKAGSNRYERRNAARCLLLSPVWPVLLVYGLFTLIREVWYEADIPLRRR